MLFPRTRAVVSIVARSCGNVKQNSWSEEGWVPSRDRGPLRRLPPARVVSQGSGRKVVSELLYPLPACGVTVPCACTPGRPASRGLLPYARPQARPGQGTGRGGVRCRPGQSRDMVRGPGDGDSGPSQHLAHSWTYATIATAWKRELRVTCLGPYPDRPVAGLRIVPWPTSLCCGRSPDEPQS